MKNVILITAACMLALLSTIGASLPYPILPPLFAAEAPNAFNNFLGLPSKLLFGLALTINPLGLLIGSALLGPLSDRYGRRPLLMRTAVGAAIGHAITAWALVIQSYPLFIVARFITGLLEGNGAVARAMLADQLQGPLRLRAMSWLNGAFYLGWLVGPILAGATLAWGVTVPFWIAAGALMLVAVLVAIGLPRETPSLLTTSWWQVARDRHSLNLLRHEELRTLFIVQSGAGSVTTHRLEVAWPDAVKTISERPILGVGYGAYKEMTKFVPHNQLLDMWVQVGIGGVILFLWMYVSLVRVAWRARHDDDSRSRAIANGLFGQFMGCVVALLFNDALFYPWLTYALFFTAVLIEPVERGTLEQGPVRGLRERSLPAAGIG